MKVIEELIQHLCSEQLLSGEQLNLLREKGFYPSIEGYDEGFDKYEYTYWAYEEFLEENAPYEEELEIEKKLNDDRRRKQGKKGRFTGAKKKGRAKVKASSFMKKVTHKNLFWHPPVKFTVDDDFINALKEKYKVPNADKLYALLNMELFWLEYEMKKDKNYDYEWYFDVYRADTFWGALASRIGTENLIQNSDSIIEAFNQQKTLKKHKDFFITITAYLHLLKDKNVFTLDSLCRSDFPDALMLYLFIDNENIIKITDRYGRLELRKLTKEESKYRATELSKDLKI